MTFHRTNLGLYGESLPSDRNGFVTCSPRKVSACARAPRAGREPSAWADTGANLLVARAEMAISDWRTEA
jgi:hypothetical protein